MSFTSGLQENRLNQLHRSNNLLENYVRFKFTENNLQFECSMKKCFRSCSFSLQAHLVKIALPLFNLCFVLFCFEAHS